MAGNAVIGALRVVLGADSAALETGLKDAQSKLANFGAGVAKAGAIAATAFVAAGVAIGAAVKGAIDQADNLGKMAQKVGVPVEELSALKHAADLSGVSLESLGKGLGRLSKSMVEAAAKPTSEAANAFRALGVDVVDPTTGKLKSLTQVTGDMAGKFEGLKDGAGKTAVSMALLGKSGADLIPMLNAGKAGLQEMMAEAAALGIVIDTQTAKSAEAFNDNLTRMGKIAQGVIIQVAAHMLPAFQRMSEVMLEASKNTDLMKGAADVLTGFLRGAVTAAVTAGLVFNRLGVELSALWETIKAPTWEKMKEGWAKFTAAGDETKQKFEGLKELIGKFWTDAEAGAKSTAAATGGAAKAQKDFNYAAMAGKTALDLFLESQKKGLAAQQAELATVGMAAGAKERLRVVMQTLSIATANQTALSEPLLIKMTETANAAEQLALKLQGAQLIQQNLTPGEAFRQEMENNRLAMEAFGASASQIAQVQQATAERYGNTWGQVGEQVAGSFEQIGQSFAKESKSMAMVAKVAGIAHSTISMFVGMAKALELPFPANLAAWAKVAALGASAIAGIKGVSAGGFSTGGAITVPGGMGGGDRVRAMVDLEPGEQLDIWRPGQGGSDPRRGAGGGGTIRLEGVSEDHWYSGKQLRKFVEAFNEQAGELRLNMA